MKPTRSLQLAVFLLSLHLMFHSTRARAEDVQKEVTTPPALPEVLVKGKEDKNTGVYNPKELSLPKIPTPVLDTPQSTTTINKEVMQDQGATTLRDALHNVSGVSISAGEGGNQGDSLTIRGFSARSDMFIDGMRDFGSYFRDPFNLEAVEVLKGPASMTFGRGSTGGVVNQQSKMPELESAASGSLGLGTDLTRRATADINTPLTSFGENKALRVNLMTHDAHVAGRDIVENRRFGLAPTYSSGIGTAKRFTFSFLHQTEDNIADYGLPWLFNKPADVDRHNFYGFENADFHKTNVNVATMKFERDLSDTFTLRNQTRVAYYKRQIKVTDARAVAGTPLGASPENVTVNRNQIVSFTSETIVDNDLSLITEFNTGSVKHNLVAGFEAIRETADPLRYSYTGVPTTNMANPDTGTAFQGTPAVNSRVQASNVTLGTYVTDAMEFSPEWEFVTGVRWDNTNAEYDRYDSNPNLAFQRTDNMYSWRGGVVFKPRPNGSVYVNYGNSFNPSAETFSLAANTVNLKPEESRTSELGTKWDLRDERVSITAAVFRTDKINARTPDPNDPTLNVLSGEHQVQGFEMGLSGKVTNKLQLLFGYSFQDAFIKKTNTPAELGARLTNSPAHTGSLWATYDISPKFQVGAGARGVSKRTASTSPEAVSGLVRTVPGYVVSDAMVKYKWGKEIDIQVNLYNMMDEFYYDGIHSQHIIPGMGRTAIVTTQFHY